MTRTRHSETEIRRMLRESQAALARGATIPKLCQTWGISEATFHRWRNRYASEGLADNGQDHRRSGSKQDLTRRLKELEKENKRLKQLVGQLMLDNALLKDALESRQRR